MNITQTAREAAAKLIKGQLGWYNAEAMIEGEMDQHEFVQALAAAMDDQS